jgi:curli biogenesis system outer membrane secretion channel CsgG
MKSLGAVLSALSLTVAINFVPASAADTTDTPEKVRIAIMPFDYGAVVSQVGSVDVGKGVSSLMITRLVKDSKYTIMEREALNNVLQEQDLSNSNRANPATAVKIGKMLGVDAIVVGTITQFGFESKNMNVGAGAATGLGYVPYFGGWAGGFGAGSLGVHKSKVKVAIDARVVDTSTGEILAAFSGEGESKRGGMSLWGSGGGGGGAGGGGFDFGSSNFASSIAGEATVIAVDSLTSQLEAQAVADKMPQAHSVVASNVQGRVADVTDKQVCVNVGKMNGLKVGDKLVVEHPYKTIKDPDTGKVLRELTNPIAVVTLTDISDNSSMGQIDQGGGAAVGDYVRSYSTSVSAVLLSPPTTDAATTTSSASSTPNAAIASKPVQSDKSDKNAKSATQQSK